MTLWLCVKGSNCEQMNRKWRNSTRYAKGSGVIWTLFEFLLNDKNSHSNNLIMLFNFFFILGAARIFLDHCSAHRSPQLADKGTYSVSYEEGLGSCNMAANLNVCSDEMLGDLWPPFMKRWYFATKLPAQEVRGKIAILQEASLEGMGPVRWLGSKGFGGQVT